jgi:hypothetical protein
VVRQFRFCGCSRRLIALVVYNLPDMSNQDIAMIIRIYRVP